MSYYYRGNLALEVQKEKQPVKRTKQSKVAHPSITLGEKLTYLVLLFVFVAGCVLIGWRYVQISQLNYTIQMTKQEISRIQSENSTLQSEIEQMSNRSRIVTEAEKMGMVTSKDNVKVLTDRP
jgi:cell division protein FtsL